MYRWHDNNKNVRVFSLICLYPLSITCRLVYDITTDGYNNTPGVEIRVPGFGETKTVEYLSSEDNAMPSTAYMKEIVNFFVERGYVRNKTIRAAPYDWRLSAGMWSS